MAKNDIVRKTKIYFYFSREVILFFNRASNHLAGNYNYFNMNLCIIRKQKDEEARYLYEEFKKKDFSKIFLADLTKLNIRISKKKISVNHKTELKWDIFILKCREGDFPFSYSLADTLEKQAIVLPSAKAVLACSDRGLLAKAIFDSKIVLQPLTYLFSSPEAAKKVAVKFNKFALKFHKHGGKGVVILDKTSTATDFLDVFSGLAQPFCIQRFIKGDVIKVLVVGEEVIAVKEYPSPDMERSNLGRKEYVRIKEEVKADLRAFAKHLNAFLLEVDLIEKNQRYFIIDISLNPDVCMYARLSGKNVGAIFADFILRNYSAKQIAGQDASN